MTDQKTLKALRAEIEFPTKVTQEMMARDSRITLVTYRKVEGGSKTTYGTARSILNTLNAYRKISKLSVVPECDIPVIFNLE